jgi:hypothetical protein
MTWNQLAAARRQLSFHDVEIGAANAACANSQQNVTGCGFRPWDLRDVERPGGNRFRCPKNRSCHLSTASPNIVAFV